jgi:tetratricopeptide (TPR) repeat protein
MKKVILMTVAIVITATLMFAQNGKPEHPFYLHALSDLRAARWMLEHRPGNWQQTTDEIEAVKRIDAAINEIKKASIDDGKDINDHPKVDEIPDHAGRLHKANDFLKKAREDVNKDEDNAFAKGLKKRALDHINEAIKITDKAIKGV